MRLAAVLLLLAQQRGRSLTVEEMTPRAALVGVATVRSVSPRLGEENGKIYTDHVLRFKEVWKGDAAGDVTLTQPGGTVGDRAVVAVGFTFTLTPGEEVLVFAVPWKAGYTVLGMNQGLYRIAEGTTAVREGRRESAPVAELRDAVRRAVGAPGAAPASAADGEPPPAGPPPTTPPPEGSERGLGFGLVVVTVIVLLAVTLGSKRRHRGA